MLHGNAICAVRLTIRFSDLAASWNVGSGLVLLVVTFSETLVARSRLSFEGGWQLGDYTDDR